MDKAVSFIVSCMNFDGGFGCVPGSESHSGQVNVVIILWLLRRRQEATLNFQLRAAVLKHIESKTNTRCSIIMERPEKLSAMVNCLTVLLYHGLM